VTHVDRGAGLETREKMRQIESIEVRRQLCHRNAGQVGTDYVGKGPADGAAKCIDDRAIE
jgi:hypothetical protein